MLEIFSLCCLDVCLHAMNGFLAKVDENNITVTSYQRFTEIPTVREIDAYLNVIKKTSRSMLITYFAYYLKIIQSLYEICNNWRHFCNFPNPKTWRAFGTLKVFKIPIYFYQYNIFAFISVVFICAEDDNFRNIMIRAHRLGMTSGDYVFIDPNFLSNDDHYRYRTWFNKDSDDVISREAYRHVIHVGICSYCWWKRNKNMLNAVTRQILITFKSSNIWIIKVFLSRCWT